MINYFKVPLEGHEQAQAHVLIGEDTLTLVSYTTYVIHAKRLDYNTYELSCSGLYSRTTIKHIGWFIKEYFPNYSYYDIKKIAGTNETIILTRGIK